MITIAMIRPRRLRCFFADQGCSPITTMIPGRIADRLASLGKAEFGCGVLVEVARTTSRLASAGRRDIATREGFRRETVSSPSSSVQHATQPLSGGLNRWVSSNVS